MSLAGFIGQPEPEEMKPDDIKPGIGLWDIVGDLSHGKQHLAEKEEMDTGEFPRCYSQYVINQSFGNTLDTCLLANELNIRRMPDHAHHDFLMGLVPSRRRRSKWFKKTVSRETQVDAVSMLMGMSRRLAETQLGMFTDDELDEMVKEVSREGWQKRGKNGRRT